MKIEIVNSNNDPIHTRYNLLMNGVFVGEFIIRQSKKTFHINWANGFEYIFENLIGDASLGTDYVANELKEKFEILEPIFDLSPRKKEINKEEIIFFD